MFWSRGLFNRRGLVGLPGEGVVRLPGGTWAGERDEGRGTRDEGRGTRDDGRGTTDEGRRTKEAAEEKEEIHIMKPSFCAEGSWADDVGGDYFVDFLRNLNGFISSRPIHSVRQW